MELKIFTDLNLYALYPFPKRRWLKYHSLIYQLDKVDFKIGYVLELIIFRYLVSHLNPRTTIVSLLFLLRFYLLQFWYNFLESLKYSGWLERCILKEKGKWLAKYGCLFFLRETMFHIKFSHIIKKFSHYTLIHIFKISGELNYDEYFVNPNSMAMMIWV